MIACLALYCRSNGQMIFEKQTMGSRKVVVFAFFLQALLCLVEASSVGVVSKTIPRAFFESWILCIQCGSLRTSSFSVDWHWSLDLFFLLLLWSSENMIRFQPLCSSRNKTLAQREFVCLAIRLWSLRIQWSLSLSSFVYDISFSYEALVAWIGPCTVPTSSLEVLANEKKPIHLFSVWCILSQRNVSFVIFGKSAKFTDSQAVEEEWAVWGNNMMRVFVAVKILVPSS